MKTDHTMTRRDMLAVGATTLPLLGVAASHAGAEPQPKAGPESTAKKRRIIDMHLHCNDPSKAGRPKLPAEILRIIDPTTRTATEILKAKDPTTRSEEQYRKDCLAELEKHNIVKAVLSGPLENVHAWCKAAPERLIAGVSQPGELGGLPDYDVLRQEVQTGRIRVMGELGLQYVGLTPDDPKLDRYFALAEDFDVPVALHTGLGPPFAAFTFAPKYRTRFGNPVHLEEVLVRHPRLRVYLMHAGGPWLEGTLAIMGNYPHVYADLAVINWVIPREAFHDHLQRLMRGGLGKRLMFGSDQMVWPEAIGKAIEGIESASFLTDEQKDDIFYNNARRFLQLDDKDNMPTPAKKEPKK